MEVIGDVAVSSPHLCCPNLLTAMVEAAADCTSEMVPETRVWA